VTLLPTSCSALVDFAVDVALVPLPSRSELVDFVVDRGLVP